MTNEEMLLTALTSGATINPKFQPQNNKQAYLAYLCGLEIDLPAPRTAEEALMCLLCVNGGAGGSEGDGIDVALTEQEALIAELQDVLKGKASGGGSVSAPLTVNSLVEDGVLGTVQTYRSVTISDGVTSIGDGAFDGFGSLWHLTIPSSVTSIGSSALTGAYSLAHIYYAGTVAEWRALIESDSFYPYDCTIIIHCSDGDIRVST